MLKELKGKQKKDKEGGTWRKACIIYQATSSGLPQQVPLNIAHARQVLEGLRFHVEIAELSRSKHSALHSVRNLAQSVDVFFNMYRRDDATAQAIINYFFKNGIPFIGSRSISYPSKTQIKKLCMFYNIPTPLYQLVDNQNDLIKCKESFEFPLFVKTEHRLEFQGVSPKFMVRTSEQLRQKIQYIWKNFGGALVEPFIQGNQFTVLVAGSKGKCKTYPAVQILFGQENQNELDLGQLWKPVQDLQLNERLQKFAKDLYYAVQTQSCATIKIIQDLKTGQLLILDFDPYPLLFLESSSVDQILKFSKIQKGELISFLLDHAFERSKRYNTHKYQVVRTKEHGMHIIAKEDIKKDEFIYTDEMQPIRIVTDQYYKKNWIEEDKKDFEENAWPIGHRVFGLWSSNPADWKPLNHSCDPSIYVNLLSYYARRDIKKGQPLTINFSTYQEKHPQFKCWCKTQYCKGKVVPDEYKTKQFQERFKGQLGSYIEGLVLALNEENKQLTNKST